MLCSAFRGEKKMRLREKMRKGDWEKGRHGESVKKKIKGERQKIKMRRMRKGDNAKRRLRERC